MRPGLAEYQIAATMVGTYLELGCERSAYAPIVASGPNSVVLHYSANRRRIEAGDLVVMDVGGQYADYTTDVTRTVPASGKFTPRQREIYDIVLAAQKAAIAAVKPGMSLLGDSSTSLRKIAMDYIDTHGKDLHGGPLGKYFVHGLGHFVGLEVHDPGSFDTRLEPGMVITIEPGIYLPEENLGIRIEDTVLVTANWRRSAQLRASQGSRRDREAGWQVGAISFTSACWPDALPLGRWRGGLRSRRAWITTPTT